MKKINSIILIISIPLVFVLFLYVFFTFNGLCNLFQISDSEYSFVNEYEKIYELNRNIKYFDIAIDIKETNGVKEYNSNLIIEISLFDKKENCMEVFILEDFDEPIKYTQNSILIRNRERIIFQKKKYIGKIKIKVLQTDENLKTGKDTLYISNMVDL